MTGAEGGEMLIGVRGAAELYVHELNFDVVCDGVVGSDDTSSLEMSYDPNFTVPQQQQQQQP